MKKKKVKLTKTKPTAQKKKSKSASRAAEAAPKPKKETPRAEKPKKAAAEKSRKKNESGGRLFLSDRIAALFFPPRCMFCDEVLAPGTRCESCDARLDDLKLKGRAGRKEGMSDKTLDMLDETAACYEYAEDVAEAVIRYKFCGETAYFREMARRIAEALANAYDPQAIELVVQVPAFEADDGHSRLLAQRVAKLLGAKFDGKALVKIAPTRKQHELGRAEREINIKNAFDVPDRKRVEGKTVLICDDVVTSGSTLNECARALREAGAQNVVAVAFASTFMGSAAGE